jgi:hypothetical protein
MPHKTDPSVKDAWVAELALQLLNINDQNGYKSEVKRVFAEETALDQLGALPAIVLTIGPDTTLRRTSGFHWKRCQVFLDAYLYSQAAPQQTIRNFEADLEKFVYGDRYTTGTGFSINGKAFEMNILSFDPFGTTAEQPNCGTTATLQVDYHQRDTEPTQIA